MFDATADIYDELYAFKDYSAEVAKIRALIATERPGAQSILDVACGTGAHAAQLASDFEVEGIDLEPAFIRIASIKLPTCRFHQADMRRFQLDRKFDVVQCLFSSIGYLLHDADIIETLGRFRAHLAPGGVIFVEPWLAPDVYQVGVPHMHVSDRPERKIARLDVSQRDGDVSVLHFHYLIATREGVRHAEEIHRLRLMTPAQLADCFEAAGLSCRFDPVGLFGRGLFIARHAASSTIAGEAPHVG